MADFLDSLAALGTWSGEALWLPLSLWTLVALLVLASEAWLPLRRPLVRQRLLVALLVALPVGMTFRLVHPLVLPEQTAPPLTFFVPEEALPAPAPDVSMALAPERPLLPMFAGVAVLMLGLAAASGLVRLTAQHFRLHRWLRELPMLPEEALSARTQVIAAQLRLPSVRIRLVDAEVSPFTYGLLRPVVVLPARLADDEEAFRLALAHEAAHVAHGDAVWHLAARLAAALVPWHPLAWRLLRQAELRREQAADAYVLGHFPVAHRQYAHLLLDFGAVPAPAAALAASIHQLKPRVAAMKTMLNLRARGIAPALLLLFSLSATLSLRAQDTTEIPVDVEVEAQPDVYVVVEEQPTIIPNNKVGMENLQASIRYPEIAKQAGIQGRVIVQFVVNEMGTVEDAKIVRGIGGGADEEALRAVREMRFTPGRQHGEAVKVQMTLPVTFRLGDAPSGSTMTREHIEALRQRIRELEERSPEANRAVLNELKEILRQIEARAVSTGAGVSGNDGEGTANTLQLLDVQRNGGRITGRILDRRTGQALFGANVVVDGTQIGAATDREGRFVLTAVPEDATALRATFVGFENLVVPVANAEMAATPVPEGYVLKGVPNPSGDKTEILFAVPEAGQARVEVYNAIGQRVAVLFDEMAAPGQTYRVIFDGAARESGVYFFRLTHEGHTMTHANTLAR